MASARTTLSLPLSASDAEGDRLAWSAQVGTIDAAGRFNPLGGTRVTASMAGNVLTINRVASYLSDFFVRVNVSDGSKAATQTFRVSVSAAAPLRAASVENCRKPSNRTGPSAESPLRHPSVTLPSLDYAGSNLLDLDSNFAASTTAAVFSNASSASLHDEDLAPIGPLRRLDRPGVNAVNRRQPAHAHRPARRRRAALGRPPVISHRRVFQPQPVRRLAGQLNHGPSLANRPAGPRRG